MEKEYTTPKKVAQFLECHYHTVLEWCKKGTYFEVKKIKKGLSYKYEIETKSLLAFLTKKGYIESEHTPPPEPPATGKNYIILVEGIHNDNYINESGRLTASKNESKIFTSESLAKEFIKEKVHRATNCKIIEN